MTARQFFGTVFALESAVAAFVFAVVVVLALLAVVRRRAGARYRPASRPDRTRPDVFSPSPCSPPWRPSLGSAPPGRTDASTSRRRTPTWTG